MVGVLTGPFLLDCHLSSIYGYSFTNPLETLLWTQANELRSIDFRYYTQSTLKDYITEHKPDIVICVRDETAFLSEAGNGITE